MKRSDVVGSILEEINERCAVGAESDQARPDPTRPKPPTKSRGCPSFICFGRVRETLSHLKVGPTEVPQTDALKHYPADSLKSSLKSPTSNTNANDGHGCGYRERRKVQWTDKLFVINEFEPSEHSGSDDEFEDGNGRIWSC
ncbi:hypothetical protein M8C21_010952, partial [Ambrosia artemisiifolia]